MKTEKEYFKALGHKFTRHIGNDEVVRFDQLVDIEQVKSYANYVALFRVGELLDEQTNQIMSSQIRIFDNVPYRRCDEVDELITKHRPAQPSDTKHAQVESTEGRPHKLVEVPPEHGDLDFGGAGVLMPRELTHANGSKGLMMGEFFEEIQQVYEDEDGNECVDVREIYVSWTTIKAIYKKLVEHHTTTLNQQQD